MVLTPPQLMTFAEFLDWNPQDGRYELINGVAVERQPKGKHEEIIDFLENKLRFEVARLHLACLFPKRGLIKAPDKNSGYCPDVLIIDRNALATEPLWEQYSTITKGDSVRLVIEVVSNNWRDDYAYKLADYETLLIPEYWIIDYLGIGGKRYIGDPKQPTITICELIEGEYQLKLFRDNEKLISRTFPEINLTAKQIFDAV